jgi:hypothetical protein
MNDELFTIPETLSPRLAWMRDNGISTREIQVLVPQKAWQAEGASVFSTAENEQDALVSLARKMGIRLWNGA